MKFDANVIVVGAGVAGLSAAAALRRAGRSCIVLEALARSGGRAWTTPFGDAAFDQGAYWLHAAERNPLTDLARATGETLRDAQGDWTGQVRVGHRPATDAEREAYGAAWEEISTLLTARAAQPGDIAFADALAPLRGNPWAATIETWEACLIAAAPPAEFSLHDWQANELTGSNLNVAGGLGAFIERRLAPLAGPVRHATPVRRITWDRPGGVEITTPAGRLTARACIVTVSTGVLAAGGIEFDPPLPAERREAIAALPMGLLSKVALRADGPDRFGLPQGASVHRQVVPGARAMFFLAWPGGADHVVGFIGGPDAWDLSRAGPQAAEAFARAEFASLLDGNARMGAALVTDWGENPAFLGAYAYARPGHAAARAAMDTPLGALLFAGEAWCSDGLAGTVAGAFNSGARAAALALEIADGR